MKYYDLLTLYCRSFGLVQKYVVHRIYPYNHHQEKRSDELNNNFSDAHERTNIKGQTTIPKAIETDSLER